MNTTVILAINAKYIHSSLSAWILTALIPHSSVIEANINQCDTDIVDSVVVCNPGTVAISTYIWNAAKLPRIIELIRKRLPQVKIVLGGPEATHNANYWRNHADAVHVGEFDKDFIDPYSDKYLAALANKIAYIETSRGCPFSCAFCLSGNDSNVKYLDISESKKRIRKLAGSEARMVKFVDRTFNCNAARAYEIFEFVMGLDTEKTFHFEVAADLFDSRTLSLLASSPPGRIQLEIGLQSFHKPALQASSRKTNLDKAEASIREIMSHGNIHVHVDLIAGLPFEMIGDFAESFNRAYLLNAHRLQLGFLKLLHGSKMREQFPEIAHSPEAPYEIIGSPWLSATDLAELKMVAHNIDRTYNKGRSLSAHNYALNVSGVTPFEFYRRLSTEEYLLENLPGVKRDELTKCMICDCLAAQKGVNMLATLRSRDKPAYRKFRAFAEETLGRRINRNEVAVLPDGGGVFADSESRDPVTGLYELHFCR
jgi:hypothetical protein